MGVTGAAVTSRSLIGLQSLTEYEVQVAATNGQGGGPYSQVAMATTITETTPGEEDSRDCLSMKPQVWRVKPGDKARTMHALNSVKPGNESSNY